MSRLRQSCGQAYVISILFLSFVLVGMTAAVLDVGSWFRADRALQATVDAAALAGAQALPDDPGAATALAVEYGNKNGGSISAGNVKFASKFVGNDTIMVEATRPAPGFFARMFGIDTVTVHAKEALPHVLTTDAEVDGADVLPGFRCAVRALVQGPEI